MAKYIQDKIWNEVGMPVSIGISRSKTLAKLASDRAKTTKDRILLLGKSKSKKYLQGEKVTLVGFGTFERRQRAARTGRNPQTGATLKIAAKKVPAFSAGKKFKELVK